jgi:hypothetical protein
VITLYDPVCSPPAYIRTLHVYQVPGLPRPTYNNAQGAFVIGTWPAGAVYAAGRGVGDRSVSQVLRLLYIRYPT